MHGFLNLDKPAGMTSHDVVARVRRLVGRGVKVGHAGTLDPAATGVLPLALGHATRLIEYLVDARKGYRALVRLGVTTTTDDGEGEVVTRQALPAFDRATIEAALAPLRGPIMQLPPMYAALHHEGKRLYELARQGIEVERTPRPVTIYRLGLVAYAPEPAADQAHLTLDVECSKGTYVRALARDLGVALGCGAHLAALRRTAVGPFRSEDAAPLAALLDEPAILSTLLLSPAVVVADWPAITLEGDELRRVCNGITLALPLSGDQARVHSPDGTLVALLRRAGALWQPAKVLK